MHKCNGTVEESSRMQDTYRSHNVSDCSAAYVHPSFSWPGVKVVAQDSRSEATRIRAPVLILRAARHNAEGSARWDRGL